MEKLQEPKRMKCPRCKKWMKKQYDPIQKKVSGYLWRCENCMKDKNAMMAIA